MGFSIRALLIALAFALLSFHSPAHAQNTYSGEGGIDIWNSNILWAQQGNFAYVFTIDALGLSTAGISEISDLVIQTNFGDITFSDTITSFDADRYKNGTLISPEVIEKIQITKAIGVVDGKMWDLTRLFTVGSFTPVTIGITPK